MTVPARASRPPLRVAVVGLGRWGSRYVSTLQRASGFEIVVLCDADPAARARTEATTNQPIVSSVEEALEAEVDAVVVATPLLTHAPLAMRCLERGLHVLVEKPLATTALAARSLVAEASRASRCLLVGHLTLHHPGFQQVLALVRAGAIGELTYVQAERTSTSREGAEPVLWALGPHDVSAFATLACAQGQGLSAVSHMEATTVDEQTTLRLRLETGLRASFVWRRCASPQVRSLTVSGTKGTLVLNELTGEVTGTKTSSHPVGPGSLLGLQCEHFLQCIREQSLPMSGPIAVATVAILAAAESRPSSGHPEPVECGPVECGAHPPHPNRDDTVPLAMSRV